MAFSAQHIRAAQQHLKREDPVMKLVLKQVGPFTLRLKRNRYNALADSIVSQQISSAAAKTISGRLYEAAGDPDLRAEKILSLGVEGLRSVGVSAQKAGYLLDLSRRIIDQELDLSQLGRLGDEIIIERLTQVKGIGRWTAQMFLIFSLGRLDVAAHDDLGLKTAMLKLYQLDELPNRETFHEVASAWRPYASVASWYLWRAMDLKLDAEQLGLSR